MAEFIVRLTDEQERLLRLAKYKLTATERVQLDDLRDDLLDQTRRALALYDQLVAEAKAASEAAATPAVDPEPEASTLDLLAALEKAVNDAKEARRRGRLHEQATEAKAASDE